MELKLNLLLGDYRLMALAVIVTLAAIADGVKGEPFSLTFKNRVIQRFFRWSMAVVCPLLFIWDGILVSMRIGIIDAMVQIFVCFVVFLAWWLLFGIFFGFIFILMVDFLADLRKGLKWLYDHLKDLPIEFKNWLCE